MHIICWIGHCWQTSAIVTITIEHKQCNHLVAKLMIVKHLMIATSHIKQMPHDLPAAIPLPDTAPQCLDLHRAGCVDFDSKDATCGFCLPGFAGWYLRETQLLVLVHSECCGAFGGLLLKKRIALTSRRRPCWDEQVHGVPTWDVLGWNAVRHMSGLSSQPVAR